MKIETLNKKIEKEQEKVNILRIKYEKVGKDYSEATKRLNGFKELKQREEEREKYSMLEKACAEKNIDVQRITNALSSGELDGLFGEPVSEMENSRENEVAVQA